jgi:hypothetical protein
MNDRPAPVRIDDLAQPRFTDEVRAILDFMSEAGSRVALQPSDLMDAAITETGLHDFGPTDFQERLEVLCRALGEEGGFNQAGIMMQHTLLVGLLKNLHNLISSDPAMRSLPYWESLEPLLAEAERPVRGQADPRLARTDMALSFLDISMPYFNRMHEMTVDHAHEEIQLLAIDFSTMLFETTAPMPMWRDYYLSHDQQPSYDYLLRILKVLQWARGGTRWVLKSPQHLEQFPVLSRTFPDATFVVTHRDPVSVTASMVMMLAYTARLNRDRVDVVEIGRYWSDRLATMLRRCAEERDVLPPERTIDVRFDEFMANDMAMVEQVYRLAGQPFDDRSSAAMATFMAQHPRGRHGSVVYDLAEFGLEQAELRAALSFYSDRFGVTAQS